MNPDSFRGKVWLSVIDKIIIGVIAGLIALYFQQNADKSKKLFDESVAVSKIHTENYLKQRKGLADAMEELFSFIEKVKSNQVPTDKDFVEFTQLRWKFSKIFYMLEGDDPEIMKPGEPFLKSITHMSDILTDLNNDAKEIEEQRKLIWQHYSAVLDKLQDLTRQKVKEEFEAVAGKKKKKVPIKEEKIEPRPKEKHYTSSFPLSFSP
jgi:hypothetical protein